MDGVEAADPLPSRNAFEELQLTKSSAAFKRADKHKSHTAEVQPARQKQTPLALRGMQPPARPLDTEGSSQHAPTARTARSPPLTAPSRPRAAPALPGSAPAPQTASGPQQPPSGGDGRRRRRVRREEGDAKVEAQPRVAALRAMPAAAHRQEQAAAMSRRMFFE